MEAVLLNAIVGHPTLNFVWHLVEDLTAFTSHFATTKWRGKHNLLLLVPVKTKIRFAAGNQNLDCKRIKNTELLNPKIEEDTKGSELLRFQEEHRVN